MVHIHTSIYSLEHIYAQNGAGEECIGMSLSLFFYDGTQL